MKQFRFIPALLAVAWMTAADVRLASAQEVTAGNPEIAKIERERDGDRDHRRRHDRRPDRRHRRPDRVVRADRPERRDRTERPARAERPTRG